MKTCNAEVEHVTVWWHREDGRQMYYDAQYDELLNMLAAKIENRHGTLRGIGSTLREAFNDLQGNRCV